MAGVTAAKNQHQVFDVSLPESGPKCFDDDGRLKRTGKILCYLKVLFFFFLSPESTFVQVKFVTDGSLFICYYAAGTLWTASAHIITAVIGSGVLSLAWATAQLGWIAGPSVMFLFSFVTYYTSTLLAACYRSGDPVTGKRNYTYVDAVRSNLGIISLL